MLRGGLVWLMISVFVVLLGGCRGGDPHALPVAAKSGSAFAQWRMRADGRYSRDEWREFDAVVQEIKMGVMADREASGRDAIEEAMLKRIDGHTFREVLVLGYETRLRRLEPVVEELSRALGDNTLLVTRPGDRDSAKYLEGLRGRQQERLARMEAEMEQAEQRLIALGQSPANLRDRSRTRNKDASSALPRQEAMARLAGLVREQLAAARLSYGERPVQIDRDGSALKGEDLAEFKRRRDAAGSAARTVIAVRVQDRWWIYDGPAESPTLSDAVTANLTEADRREIDETWWTMQAEVWARKMAYENAQP